MKHIIFIRTVCLGLALTIVGGLFAACAKKEGPVRAMAAFVVGTVTLERPGAPARQLAHREEIMQGDVVKTGPGSMLVIQLGKDSVIKMESDTTVSMDSVMGRDGTRLGLEQGRVLSRLKHLTRGTDFRISTKTYIAAVRGTEFSASYGKDDPVIAVNNGAVEVTRVAAGAEEGKGEMVGAGKAAVVKETITTRPVSADEKKEFDRFRNIEPIGDLEKATESDLKKIEAGLQKDSGGDASKDSESDEAKKVVLWTGKGVYSSADTIVVYYKNMPEYRNAWIDVSRASDGDGRYQTYNWTYSAKNGKMEFPGLGLEPGVYEVRAHFGRSTSVDKRIRFRVQ